MELDEVGNNYELAEKILFALDDCLTLEPEIHEISGVAYGRATVKH